MEEQENNDGAVVEEAPAGAEQEIKEEPGGMAEAEEPQAEPGKQEPEPQKAEDKTPLWMKREIFEERQRRRDAEERIRQLEQQPTPVQTPALKEPNPDDFDDVNDYNKAQRVHDRTILKQELREEFKQEQIRNQQDAQLARVQNDWTSIEAKAVQEKPDYFDAAENFKTQVSNPQGGAILQSVLRSKNSELVYHLGNHPEEVSRIMSLQDPWSQATEIGRVSASLETKTPHVSNKPEPIKKPKGGGTGGTVEPKTEDSDAEWIRKRELQLKKRRAV